MRALLAIGALFVLGSSDTPALAASQSGTGLTASVSTTRHFTITYTSSLAKSDDPATKMVAVRTSANMHWTITATRVRSGTLGGDVDFIGLS